MNKITASQIESLKKKYHLIGDNPKYNEALQDALKAAQYDMNVLVNGESGVGKDIFARIIHEESNRKKEKLIPVNCGALPEGTIESELFGHVKGAFTSAEKDRKGYFEIANNGTIFLDEIGELPLSIQVKLLRVLENGEILPVGSSEPRKVNVRIVGATNVDLQKAIQNGKFREDLYYRLCQSTLTIPPLRERKEDILWLFREFTGNIASTYNIPFKQLDDNAKQMLINYPWKGNIRQLKNVAEHIIYFEDEPIITKEILQKHLEPVTTNTVPMIVGAGHDDTTDRELLLKALSMGQIINDMRREIAELKQTVTSLLHGQAVAGTTLSSPSPQTIIDNIGTTNVHLISKQETDTANINILHQPEDCENYQNDELGIQDNEIIDDDSLSLDDREYKAIKIALQRYKTREEAAKALSISARTLYRKIKRFNLN